MKDYANANIKITKRLLDTQGKSEKTKIKMKRHTPIAKIVSKYANKNKDLPLLDVGSREGNLLKLLSENGFKNLCGVDISEDAIKLLRQKGFVGRVLDIQNFDLKRLFNTIILSHVLEHCPNAKRVLENIYKHAAEGAILYVEVPRQPKIPMPTKAGHYHHYDELTEFLDLFSRERWKLLYANYERGGNKGVIKTVFRRL